MIGKVVFSLYMLVGTYTSGTSTGIYVYRFDEENGTIEYVSATSIVNPSYLTISADERYVYSVSEKNVDAEAYAYSFDKKNGVLTLLNTQKTSGAVPCYISVDKGIAVTANYMGGSISVFPIAENGLLQPVSKVFEFEGTGPVANRQDKPHLHCAIFSPDKRYLFAADLGSDQLHKFSTLYAAPFLEKTAPSSYKLEPGSGPRHITFHPNGKYAYLVNELSGKVTLFHYANGNLEPVQYILSDTSPGVGGKGSADIHVSPDGKFLYASNRANTNNISIFKINETDGMLTVAGYQPTGKHPRNFIISPNGKYLLVACSNSNMIQVFEIDKKTGLLTENASKQLTGIDKPVCLKFIKM